MPLSRDPEARRRQLQNLRRGRTVGTGRPPTHGARARMTAAELDPKVRSVFEALADDAPIREGDALPNADAPVVRMLAEVLVRLDRITDYIDRKGWEGEDGEPRPVLSYETTLRGQALTLMRELGLTPAARLKLGVDLQRAAAARAAAEDAESAREARERLDAKFNALDPDAEGER